MKSLNAARIISSFSIYFGIIAILGSSTVARFEPEIASSGITMSIIFIVFGVIVKKRVKTQRLGFLKYLIVLCIMYAIMQVITIVAVFESFGLALFYQVLIIIPVVYTVIFFNHYKDDRKLLVKIKKLNEILDEGIIDYNEYEERRQHLLNH